MKYPYTPKQLHMLSRKCAVLLLDVFTKIYQARNRYPLITKTLFNGINSYKLPSFVYEITDRRLPKALLLLGNHLQTFFCDYIYCNYTNYTNLNNCSAYTHTWTWLLQSLSTKEPI